MQRLSSRATRQVIAVAAAMFASFAHAQSSTPANGSVLPFPPTPLDASVVKPRLQDSTMEWPAEPRRLPKDAPNILIVLIDDVGFGIADTFGQEDRAGTKKARAQRICFA